MTTLNQIRRHKPCQPGWAKLLKHLGKTKADDEPLSLLTILESNGLDDALWCTHTEATPERIHRFALAVARRVEHLHPLAKTYNDITERFLNGTATKAELDAAAAGAAAAYAARAAAYAAAAYAAAVDTAARAAAYAADAAYAANAGAAGAAAAYAARAVAYAADAANAGAAGAAAAYAANAVAYPAAEREAQAQIFKEIFA